MSSYPVNKMVRAFFLTTPLIQTVWCTVLTVKECADISPSGSLASSCTGSIISSAESFSSSSPLRKYNCSYLCPGANLSLQ